jgi:hypothetical protein
MLPITVKGRSAMSDQLPASRISSASCPRCKTMMRELASIAPNGREPGVIAYSSDGAERAWASYSAQWALVSEGHPRQRRGVA